MRKIEVGPREHALEYSMAIRLPEFTDRNDPCEHITVAQVRILLPSMYVGRVGRIDQGTDAIARLGLHWYGATSPLSPVTVSWKLFLRVSYVSRIPKLASNPALNFDWRVAASLVRFLILILPYVLER
jgi:hypothetical protein